MKRFAHRTLIALGLVGVLQSFATAQGPPPPPFDLSTWSAESYVVDNVLAPGNWNPIIFGEVVEQTDYCQPTFFVGPEMLSDGEIWGVVHIGHGLSSGSSFGFAVGFEPGDSTNPNADYVLIEWRSVNETVDFGAPSCTPQAMGTAGLSMSRVQGIPTGDEFIGHVDFDDPCSPAGNGVTELARATTLGSNGYGVVESYRFTIRFDGQNLEVRVAELFGGNFEFELDVPVTLNSTRLSCFAFREPRVTFGSFTNHCVARTHFFGQGAGGLAGEPEVRLGDYPSLGTDVPIILENPQGASRSAFLVVGIERTSISVFDAELLVEPMTVTPYQLPSGSTSFPVAIPPDMVICGQRAYLQLFCYDPSRVSQWAVSAGAVAQFGIEPFMPG